MLSIDEAIEILKYDIEIDMYIHDIAPQLAEWLEELKAIKSDGFTDDLLNMGFTKGYNKAIDDATSVILQTLDNEILVDTLHLRLEQLKEKHNEQRNNNR